MYTTIYTDVQYVCKARVFKLVSCRFGFDLIHMSFKINIHSVYGFTFPSRTCLCQDYK